jgi:ATP-dependent Lon protease
VKEGLTIIPVSHVSEVLEHALVSKPEAIDWDEEAEEAAASSPVSAKHGTHRIREGG